MTAPADKHAVLAEVFGFADFRPGQEQVIDSVLAGHDVLAVMPTGAGKSLCYQLPALMPGAGLTIVVSPLIALMDDQVRALRLQGVAAAAIHSGLDRERNGEAWRAAVSGRLSLLYIAPERLMLDGVLQGLAGARLSRVVVDEAHCVSQWGHNFRPEYLSLSSLREVFPGTPFAAFTATADPQTRDEIVGRLLGDKAEVHVFGFDRPNIRIAVTPKANPSRQLLDFLAERPGESGIVYCLSRRGVDETTALLTAKGYNAASYHAGMPADARAANQDRFVTESGIIVVATIAFGMGIDKPDVRFVFHADLPGSLEAYYQEIGRAGRDGGPAAAHMLYGLDDIRIRRRFIDESGSDDAKRLVEHRRLNALLGLCETTECRRRTLLAAFGETVEEDCGNCDTCLEPAVVVDGTVAAQKFLSAMVRTGQRFGVGHVVDVLTGSATEAVGRHGHERLPTFGVGTEYKAPAWRSVARQLVAMGVVDVDAGAYGALKMTPRGRAVLKGEETLSIRQPDLKPARRKRADAPAAPAAGTPEAGLLARLKTLRLELAHERKVPAYVIFPDRTLSELAAARPDSLEAMRHIHGIGTRKLELFGQVFLEALNDGRDAPPAAP